MASAKEIEALLRVLAAPFPGSAVRWRVQGKAFERRGQMFGRVVAYVDARDVMERLDEVLGLNWQSRTTETAKGRVMCSIGITLPDGREIWRDDGAGETQIEGEKGAISDAFKRAAVRFGVGRYLYALPSPAVELETRDGRVVGISREAKDKLAALAHRSLERWEDDLRAMDQSEAEEQAPAAPPPPPAPAHQPEPPEQEREAPKQGAARGAAPAQPKGGEGERVPSRKFAAPRIKKTATKEEKAAAWKEWSRGPMAAIKACSNRFDALGIISVNAPAIEQATKDTGADALALFMAVINRRWPKTAADDPAPTPKSNAPEAGGDPMSIPLPNPQTKRALDTWAGKVADLAITQAETPAEVEKIIAANAEGLQLASAALQMDVAEAIRGEWEKSQPKEQTR